MPNFRDHLRLHKLAVLERNLRTAEQRMQRAAAQHEAQADSCDCPAYRLRRMLEGIPGVTIVRAQDIDEPPPSPGTKH